MTGASGVNLKQGYTLAHSAAFEVALIRCKAHSYTTHEFVGKVGLASFGSNPIYYRFKTLTGAIVERFLPKKESQLVRNLLFLAVSDQRLDK